MKIVNTLIALSLSVFGCGGQPTSDEIVDDLQDVIAPESAQLVVSSSGSHDFGGLLVGTASSHTFTVTNSGQGDASSIAASGLAGEIRYLGGTFPGTGGDCIPNLAAGASCNIVVEFAPSASGTQNAMVTISYDTNNGLDSVNVNMTGQGLAAAVLDISDSPEYDFGTVQLGNSVDATLTITNSGEFTASSIAGSGLSAPFSFKDGTFPGTGGSCLPTLAGGASCTVIVTFSPTVLPEQTQTMTISYNDGNGSQNVNRTVKGTGTPIPVANLVATTGTSHDFGNLIITQSANYTININNAGTGPASAMDGSTLSGEIHYLGGTYPGTGGDCGTDLPAGENCSIVIEYAAVTQGAQAATMTLDYNDGVAAQSEAVNLSGNGHTVATLTISSAPEYDFGTVELGTVAEVTLNISNSGDTEATTLSPSGISGDFRFKGSAYPGTGGTCGTELAGGSNCDVVLEFNPQTVPEQTQTLNVTYNDGLASQATTRLVKGTGQLPAPPNVTGLADDSTPTKSKAWTWGCDQTCEYRAVINQNPTHTFTSEPYNSTTNATQGSGTATYYIHVQARSTPYLVESVVTTASAIIDNTAPSDPVITGIGTDATQQLAATLNYTGSTDETQMSHYEIAVGTIGMVNDVVDWVSINTDNPVQYDAGSFVFSNGTDYYTSIRAVDAAGNPSGEITSGTAWQPPGPPFAITNLTVTSAAPTEISIGWTEPFNNFAAITDYFIEYKETSSGTWLTFNDGVSTDESATITGLTEETSYDFRVIAYNGSSSPYSNVATGETTIDDPFFDPTVYKAMNLGGATQSAVVNLGDANATIDVERGGSTVSIGTNVVPGGTVEFNSQLYDVIVSDQPVFVAGRRGSSGAGANMKGNIVWNSPDWAGKNFVFSATRDKPHVISFYSFEDSNEVRFYKGATQIHSQTLANGAADTHAINDDGGFRIESDGLIVAYFYSGGSAGTRSTDPRPLLPASSDVIGFPSTRAYVVSRYDNTGFAYYHSNSVIDTTNNVNTGTTFQINPQGTSSLYRSEALRVITDDVTEPVVVNSLADSNGYCAAPFLPVGMMKKRYGLNVESEWVAFASLEGGNITQIAPNGTETTHAMQKTGSDPYAPYKLRFGVLPKGTRFKADFRFAGWYEPRNDNYGADDDETIMFGADVD